jgi:outer membrane protein insertion porin family
MKSNYFFAWLLLILSSCTGNKFLSKGDTFYDGADIKIKPVGRIRGKGELKKELETFITPKRNTKILGMRPGVWFYFVAGTPKKKKGIRYLIKTKLGQPPVLLRDATPKKTSETLQAQLNNEGYFKSKVNFRIKPHKKRSKVIYDITLERPYYIHDVTFDFLDSSRRAITQKIKETTLFKKKQRYSLTLLQREQERIEELLENEGFYFFDDRYLLFKADSTVGKRKVDLELTLEDKIPGRATQLHYLTEIDVYPNYSLASDSTKTAADTTSINGYRYIDSQRNFRPDIITDAINIKPDSLYRRRNHEYTLSHLMGLNLFKFVNIKYRRAGPSDSTSLKAQIFLTPLPSKSLRFQAQGISKSNNFAGPGLELTFLHRNLFKGAEMFQLKMNGSYEYQIRNKQTTSLNALELGIEASLSVPRFISPFKIRYSSAKYLPQTQLKVGYTFQQRMNYFRLNSVNVNGGYTWRETVLKTHELFPIDLTFVQTGNTSAEFDRLLDENRILKNSFQNQFILGSRYSFTLNTQLEDEIETTYSREKIKRSNFYFNGTIELSGIIVHALQALRSQEEGPYDFFNSTFSQYIRPEIDFRYYLRLSKSQKIATRVLAGIGHPFGNSKTLPYIKQFSVGGSNSVRAFPARSVGPGTFSLLALDSASFIDQRGDMKLEGSVEYRFDIVSVLKGAVFVDAGNIWLMNEDPLRPGGKFDRHKFLNDLAVGSGFGLRFDFNFFVLRFDLAFPLRKPDGVEGLRWVVNDIDFASKSWRQENLILNVAFGYPF